VTQLVRYDEARRALEVAHSVDEVKKIRDKAEAIKAYARQAGDIEMMNWAGEIKLRAERKAGLMLKEMAELEQRAGKGRPKNGVSVTHLSDLGVDANESKRFQQSAEVPEAEFEALIEATKAKKRELTSAAVRKLARKKRQQSKHEQALLAAQAQPAAPVEITDDQSIVQCDALITDPPYGILDEPWEPAELEAFTRAWAERWNQCGAKCVLIFWSQRYLWEGRHWFDESLDDYEFRQLLVWHYPNNKSPQSRLGFKQTWEPVYFYRRRGANFHVGVSGEVWGEGLNDFDCHVAAVPQSNFNDAERKVHPAQKPVAVFRWLVNAVTQPGEIVCDPFAGSGTSGVAATQLGRRYHGIEIDAEFLRLARERVAAYGSPGIRAA
jgi:DNA modification methylase